jgi:flagellar biosynthetic protein FlhB
MAESSEQDKTEQATPRKRQEALDEGRVPRSPELATAAFLLTAALTVSALVPALTSRIAALFTSGLRGIGDSAGASPGGVVALLQANGREMVVLIAMMGSAFALVAVAVGALQGRGTFSFTPIMPKWERIDPFANAGRILGWQSIATLIKSLLKILIVGWAVWQALSAAWPDLMDLAARPPAGLLDAMRHYSVKLLVTAGLAYLVLAVADYAFQLWDYEKGLRMTKEEVKQETKQHDGDPMLRSRIRAIARSRMRRQMFKDVPKADVVIVNPTHIAVALKYDPDAAPAPIVLAMGERKIAERIKQLAFEHDVPVIENKPLARALLESAQVGMMIPAELYAAVAEVLAFVLRQRALMRRSARAWRGALG